MGDRHETLREVGDRIRAAREIRGWSQLELASRLGRGQATVCYWETGQRVIAVAALLELAQVLEVPPASLLPGDGRGEAGQHRLPLRVGRKTPHQTIYDAADVMVATGCTPESAAWLVATVNQAVSEHG
jgi:transcriptional regulator with XRE-family HTH domain